MDKKLNIDVMAVKYGDPRLSESQRRDLFEIGTILYGDPGYSFEDIKILTLEEATGREPIIEEIEFYYKGTSRSKVIFEMLNNPISDDYKTNLENIDDLLKDQPIDSHTLVKLLHLVIDADAKDRASIAASVRHIESRKQKDEIIVRYKLEKGKFKSKDDAAIAYTKDYPLEFSTIRGYLKNI